MALFGRGKRRDDEPERGAGQAPEQAPVTGGEQSGPGAGVVNVRVQDALAVWAARKDAQTFADVMRRAADGELLLDITDSTIADLAHGLQRGDVLAIASQRDNAGKHLLVAFTSNEELARYRGRPGRSLVQPAAAALAQAVKDYEGIVIDGRSAGAFIAYADEIRQQFAGDPEALGRVAHATPSRSLPFAEYLELLGTSELFIPFESKADEAGNETGVIVPGVRGQDGAAYAVAGTAPAEIWAWSARSGAQRTGLAEIARAAVANGQAGVVINPAGPSVTIPIEALRPFAAPVTGSGGAPA